MLYSIKKLEEGIEDKSKDSRILFSILAGHNAHVVTIVTVGHLLIEYHLDKIITAKVKNKKAVLKKSFSEKLKTLYPHWLPLFIYKNIKLLNNARNYAAHNLGAIEYKPIIYTPTREERILIIPKRKNAEKTYFRELINSVLFDLVNDSYYLLNISEELDFDIIFRTKR